MKKSDVLLELERYFRTEVSEALSLGDEARRFEAERQWVMYRMLPRREHGADEVIAPPSLVRVSLNDVKSWVLLVPGGGGLVLRVLEEPVQVLTPQSPLGERLLGRRRGEVVQVETGTRNRTYRILSVG